MPVEYGAANFVQTRHLTGVRVPLVSQGRVEVSQTGVDWHVARPIDIRTIINASGVTQSVNGAAPQRLQTGGDAFLSSAGLLDLLAGNVAALRTHYNVTPLDSAAAEWRLRLTPRAAGMARVIAAIEVGGCERVESVTVRQPNGDSMEIVLTPVSG